MIFHKPNVTIIRNLIQQVTTGHLSFKPIKLDDLKMQEHWIIGEIINCALSMSTISTKWDIILSDYRRQHVRMWIFRHTILHNTDFKFGVRAFNFWCWWQIFSFLSPIFLPVLADQNHSPNQNFLCKEGYLKISTVKSSPAQSLKLVLGISRKSHDTRKWKIYFSS